MSMLGAFSADLAIDLGTAKKRCLGNTCREHILQLVRSFRLRGLYAFELSKP